MTGKDVKCMYDSSSLHLKTKVTRLTFSWPVALKSIVLRFEILTYMIIGMGVPNHYYNLGTALAL